jgi:chemosensory pili system protein ChpA (sensor histidine kinase/response regulator)
VEEPLLPPPVARPSPGERPPVMEQSEDYADPELVELFIEEAKEELISIKRNFPQWRETQADTQALVTVRRSFHTLKGSGRMVGAKLLGEFAWGVENLLNRIINQTLAVGEPVLEFLDQCNAVLPQLIEQLEIGTSPRSDIHLLMKQAEAFAEGDPDATSLTSESLRVPKLELPEEDPLSHDMDPVLKEIFVKESRGHLAAMGAYIEASRDQLAPYRITDELYRACHTLSGSARMAGVGPAVAIATPLERALGMFHEEGTGLDNDQFERVTKAVSALEQYVNDLDADVSPSADHANLIGHLEALMPVAASPKQSDDDQDIEPRQTLADIDPEIAAMFTEEATELLDDAERAFDGLRGGDTVVTHVAELQRLLHTLKGGARMAGFTTMGNLSHGLEALLERWATRTQEPGEQDMTVVQATLDELHRMRDAAQDGRELPEATGLLERIDGIIHGEPVSADADELVEERPDRTTVLPALDIPESEHELPKAEEVPEDIAEATGILEVAFTDLRETPEEFGTSSIVIEDDEDLLTHAAEALADGEPMAGVDEEAEDQIEAQRLLSEEEVPDDEPPSDEAPQDETPEDEIEPPVPVHGQDEGIAEVGEARPLRLPLEREEVARVNAELLDSLLNSAGEISIFQSRLNQQTRAFEFHLTELSQTVMRLREQLRKLEMETEAQILYKHQQDGEGADDFDPLELDRYSTIQQLSRALAESVSDVASINDLLRNHNNDADTLLTQQGRVTAELQDGLMRTRMVPFQRHVSRLARIVRQAAKDTAKPTELTVIGGGELDRQVLERMLGPLEHLLRNSVVHGIEPSSERELHRKPATGQITLSVQREGSEVIIEVADDGAGLNLTAIREKAIEQKLISADVPISDEDAMELILQPGFSTARELTQTAGRGVGMDVVDNEVKTLGGSLRIHSERGVGTRFIVRLPYTLAITQALVVNVAEESFALPLPTVEGITRVPKDQLLELLTEDDPRLTYADHSYRIQHLGMFLGAGPSALPEEETAVPLILIRAGNSSTALLTDELEGSKEIVVKTLGPQVTGITGVSGATILGDGRIVVILDAGSLVRAQRSQGTVEAAPQPAQAPHEPTALVVDDSITVRRVTQRLLERHGMRVITAKDGVDAIAKLQEIQPDIILLDIEMPRMDGYQFASHVRNDPQVKDVPIVMITSRSSEKHRARAIELGVNDYLSKPYQERELVASIEPLIGRSL